MNIHPRENNQDDRRILENATETQFRDDDYIVGFWSDEGYVICAFTDYTINLNVELTGTAKGKWFHPSIYGFIFNKVFNELGCKRATFRVKKDNQRCIDLLEKANCKLECKLRGTDMLLYSMLPSDCEFIERDNG